MSNFAGFNSSKFVKGRLQAALYYARKRRREKVSGGGGGGGGGTPDGALLTKDGSSYLTTKSGDPIVVE